MSNQKYEIHTAQEDSGWTAGIIRKVTARKTIVTKSQAGFASQAEAIAWAETELKALIKVLTERHRRDTKATAES